MKILAYFLLVLGPLFIALSRPFTDKANLLLVFTGGAVGMFGLFIHNRTRRGLPVFKPTQETQVQETQVQEARPKSGIGMTVLVFLGGFGGVFCLINGVVSLFHRGGPVKADWIHAGLMFACGLILLGCARVMHKASN